MKPNQLPEVKGGYCFSDGMVYEFGIRRLRDCLSPQSRFDFQTAQDAYAYWCEHVVTGDIFNPDVENLVVLLLDCYHRIMGHYLVAIGGPTQCCCRPREVFRCAIIASASAVVLMHNHPSGNPQFSAADRQTAQVMIETGQVVGIEVLDNIVVAGSSVSSFREDGWLGNRRRSKHAMSGLERARLRWQNETAL